MDDDALPPATERIARTMSTWRDEIITTLDTGNAFSPWRELVADFPEDRINTRPPNVPYTFWQLLEHIRFCQWEILEKLRTGKQVQATWPDDFWPPRDTEVDAARWRETLRQFETDLEALKALVRDEERDLLAPAMPGASYTALASVLSVAEHNAYPLGELAILRQVCDAWGPGHRV
jgi:hypothetical protein